MSLTETAAPSAVQTAPQPEPRPRLAKPPIKPGGHLVLVHGSGFLFRAFFAVQTARRISR